MKDEDEKADVKSAFDLTEAEESYLEYLIDEVEEGNLTQAAASRIFESKRREVRARQRYRARYGDD